MPNPFYGVALVSPASVGTAVHRAWFPETTIAATIQLTSFWVQAPERFTSFQKHMAQAYIITSNTPAGPFGFPTPDKLRDSSAWLTTDNVTFRLDTDNSVVSASALGLIYDRSPSAANREDVLRTLDLAVYDDEGTVLATHREVQLYGGKKLDEDAIEEFVLKGTGRSSDASLKIARLDLSQVPSDMPIRIDPRTQRIVAPDRQPSQ